jgi:heat shock protein 110kDa
MRMQVSDVERNSVAAFTKGKVRIIASAYDRFLGGRDFDVALAEHFSDEFKV